MMQTPKALRDKKHTDAAEHQQYLARGGSDYEVVICPENLWPTVLIAKLHEEVEEIREAPTDKFEYADAIEVLYALAAVNGVTPGDIHIARNAKFTQWGGFNGRRMGVVAR